MMGPEEQVKLAFVAQEYYIAGKSRIEIAQELGLSRFKVARMLDDARDAGIVQISVDTPGPVDAELSLRLQERFGLRRAIAVATPTDDSEVVQQYLGRVAAQLLAEVVKDGDVVGLTAGRTLGAMARHLSTIAHCDVVQLAGVAGPIQSTGVEVIRRVSQIAGGEAYTIYAPLVVSDAASAQAFRRQEGVAATLAQHARVTVAMVAIGSWEPPDSQMHDNAAISGELRARLLERGVIGEIGGILLGADGAVVDDIQGLCIAATAQQLHAVPDVIGVAGGASKVRAVRAALRSGLLSSLVTDASTARSLVNDPLI